MRTDLSASSRLSTLSLTMPVAMGYIPLGIIFGFLFVQAGGAWWLGVIASLLTYAGAAQYMMIPMVASSMPVSTIALATLIVNSRHIFYGLSLLDKLPPEKHLRWYMIFALTDETYSVLTILPPSTSHRQMALIALLNHGWWVLGSALGAIIGAQARIELVGLDFVLAALFAVLMVEQQRSRRRSAPLWIALAAYVIAWSLSAEHALLIAILLSTLVAVFWQGKTAE